MKCSSKFLLLNAVMVVMVVFLFGCKSIDKSEEYKNATAHDNVLAMPKGLVDTSKIKDDYPIPNIGNGKLINVSTTPPGSKL